MRRVIIAGSRTYTNYAVVKEAFQQLAPFEDIEIVSGHARGVDMLGERLAYEYHIPLKIIPADWDTYGKAAGPIRNRQMAEYASKADGILLVFWDGKSRGTLSMIEEARKHGLRIILHSIAE